MSLITSAKHNVLQAAKGFIAGGADVDAVDGLVGRTALWWAASEGNVECATALLDTKANVNKADKFGYTPLHRTASNGHAECVRLLIQHKANVNASNNYGSSPLHFATMYGHLACVRILVAAGADRDRPDDDGITPLVCAIEENHANVAEFLLHSGAKMENVPPSIKLPPWMPGIIAKRHNAMASLRVMKGVWRRRFKVPGPASSSIANRVPRDIVNLLGLYVWSTRLDPSWGSDVLDDGQ